MTVIAIDSDPGSDAELIATTVATRLGLQLVDEAYLFERLNGKGVAVPVFGDPQFPDWELGDWRRLGIKLQCELLRLAQQDQILLHWACAPHLLAEIGHVPRIKVSAPLSVRVRRYAARCGCDEQEARRRIQQHECRTEFIFSACFGMAAPVAADTYSLVADTGWLAATDWADEIVELSRDAEFAPTAASRAMLRWRLLQLPHTQGGYCNWCGS